MLVCGVPHIAANRTTTGPPSTKYPLTDVLTRARVPGPVNSSLRGEVLPAFKKLTKLSRAAWEGDISKLTTLLKKGHDVQATDENGRTALHYAAWENHVEVAR